MSIERISTDTLEIAYVRLGRAGATPVVLLHGFPYDIHAWDAIAPVLADRGCDVIVPWLRGFGPTRFRHDHTPRSGQQAALAHDLLGLLDALGLDSALLAGYDWGGRAACIVAALQPQRVIGLVTGNGHNIQNIASAGEPAAPDDERRYWYQYYFHSERGRRGLSQNRERLCALLWREWSPRWTFDEACFARSAAAFHNPDFVPVVIHSYRHRYALEPGDPALEPMERAIARYIADQGTISVPTISLDGTADGVLTADGAQRHDRFFSGPYQYRQITDAGHNLPQEKPAAVLQAIVNLL